jgi:hypothetical protein
MREVLERENTNKYWNGGKIAMAFKIVAGYNSSHNRL